MSDPNITPQLNLNSPEDLNLWLAAMDAKMRAQNAPPPVDAKPKPPDPYETAVSEAREYAFDDSRGIRRRPDFVMDDDKGWQEVPWTY